jgi:hypothetical protein
LTGAGAGTGLFFLIITTFFFGAALITIGLIFLTGAACLIGAGCGATGV